MIRFDDVTVRYADAPAPVLTGLDLTIAEGELCLVVGGTGSGKSTLLRCINGLVPHFTGGRLTGRVTVDGRDTRSHPPRELADLVGYVGQDPLAGFVTDNVEDELAYGMESLGVPPAVMRRRIEEALDLLGLTELRGQSLLSLSAGEQQRVAIGSVLTVHPRVLVLDEPTSALDPAAAEEVLAALTRLVHDIGLTVVVAEHRLERVVQYADTVVLVGGTGAAIRSGQPADVLAAAGPVPAVVELARLANWVPVPLSVRDARTHAGPLRDRLAGVRVNRRTPPRGEPLLQLRHVQAAYDGLVVLHGIDLTIRHGERVALMGRNGAGKSTLLSVVTGLHKPTAGDVTVDSSPVHGRPSHDVVRRVGLVPHDPIDLLWGQTVDAECADADRDLRLATGTTRSLLEQLAPDIDGTTHPRDISEGQRLSLALAVVLSAQPLLVALDEPTRGLDYAAKRRLAGILTALSDRGHAVLVATHDVEFAALVTDRIVILAGGEVVADGPIAEVATSSPLFAPQVAKILAPLPLLTVDEVAAALA